MSNKKEGILSFGIDQILRNYDCSPSPVTSSIFARSDVMDSPPGHVFGKNFDGLKPANDIGLGWHSFCFYTENQFGFHNALHKPYESPYSRVHDIPAAVQRVPMAISFRTMSGDLSKDSVVESPASAGSRQGKRKKSWTRAVFSSLQRKGLERSFVAQQYISKKDRRKLAATLGLTDSQVRIWYANRRMKAKKVPKNFSSQMDCRSA